MRIAAGALFLALAAIEVSFSNAIKPHRALGVMPTKGLSREAGWGLLDIRGGSAKRE